MLGRPFYLMRRVAGEARGFRLVRDPAVLARGEALAARLGAELAKLHRVAPPVAGLEFIPVPERPAALARIAEYRAHLDAHGQRRVRAGMGAGLAGAARPAGRGAPPAARRLPHRQLPGRRGRADRRARLGVRRLRRPARGSGLDAGPRTGASAPTSARPAGSARARRCSPATRPRPGTPIDRAAVPYWEVMGTVRWAVIALMQAARHFAGSEDSLELALTAHVAAGAGARPADPRARDRGDRAMSYLRRHRRSARRSRARPCASG